MFGSLWRAWRVYLRRREIAALRKPYAVRLYGAVGKRADQMLKACLQDVSDAVIERALFGDNEACR